MAITNVIIVRSALYALSVMIVNGVQCVMVAKNVRIVLTVLAVIILITRKIKSI